MSEMKTFNGKEIVDAKARENMITKPSSAKVGQTIVVKAVDENGVPTEWDCADLSQSSGGGDWNASEGEAGHVLNRTHYDENTVVLPEMKLEEGNETDGMIEFQIATKFSLTEGKGYAVAWNGTEYECTATAFEMDGITVLTLGDASLFNGSASTGEPFLLIAFPSEIAAEAGAYGSVVPLDGSTEATIAIYGKILKKLDNKYLDLEWLPTKVLSEVELISDTTVNYNNGVGVFEAINKSMITAGEIYVIYWDGDRYECVAKEQQGTEGKTMLSLGNVYLYGAGEDTGEPFIFVIGTNEIDDETYLTYSEEGEHVVSIYEYGEPVPNKMPEEYLPENALTKTYDGATELLNTTFEIPVDSPVMELEFDLPDEASQCNHFKLYVQRNKATNTVETVNKRNMVKLFDKDICYYSLVDSDPFTNMSRQEVFIDLMRNLVFFNTASNDIHTNRHTFYVTDGSNYHKNMNRTVKKLKLTYYSEYAGNMSVKLVGYR